MNRQQYEVEKAKISQEKAVINRLKRQYNSAEKQVSEKIKKLQKQIEALTEKMLNADPQEALIIKSQIMAKVYQKDYQENLKNQISKSVDAMNEAKNRIVDDYLNECYTTGFTGSMYDIHNQGIPVIAPINPQEVEKALKLNAKVSQRLYRGYTNLMKRQIQSEISRGLLQGTPYTEMARNLHNVTNASFNNTMRIVRTEGHRIQVQSAVDACHKAKDVGADIIKQWDATLDGATRDTHRELDGKIAELDEKFEYSGGSVSAPGMFGDPAEDCNCRCCILQRARWELDEDELEILKERAEFFKLDKANEFNDFKAKYLDAAEKSGIMKMNLQFFAKVPKEKFTEYALNPQKEPNKAKAFKTALGYHLGNYDKLIENIKANIDESKFVEKGDNGYGMRYEYIMNITGENGRSANVLTAWIQDGDEKRLTSVYVTSKKETK